MSEPETNHDYLDAGVDLHALDDLCFEGTPSVLERLGPAHFRSRGFSFMGFLQTVYDHVAEQSGGQTPMEPVIRVEAKTPEFEPVAIKRVHVTPAEPSNEASPPPDDELNPPEP